MTSSHQPTLENKKGKVLCSLSSRIHSKALGQNTIIKHRHDLNDNHQNLEEYFKNEFLVSEKKWLEKVDTEKVVNTNSKENIDFFLESGLKKKTDNKSDFGKILNVDNNFNLHNYYSHNFKNNQLETQIEKKIDNKDHKTLLIELDKIKNSRNNDESNSLVDDFSKKKILNLVNDKTKQNEKHQKEKNTWRYSTTFNKYSNFVDKEENFCKKNNEMNDSFNNLDNYVK